MIDLGVSEGRGAVASEPFDPGIEIAPVVERVMGHMLANQTKRLWVPSEPLPIEDYAPAMEQIAVSLLNGASSFHVNIPLGPFDPADLIMEALHAKGAPRGVGLEVLGSTLADLQRGYCDGYWQPSCLLEVQAHCMPVDLSPNDEWVIPHRWHVDLPDLAELERAMQVHGEEVLILGIALSEASTQFLRPGGLKTQLRAFTHMRDAYVTDGNLESAQAVESLIEDCVATLEAVRTKGFAPHLFWSGSEIHRGDFPPGVARLYARFTPLAAQYAPIAFARDWEERSAAVSALPPTENPPDNTSDHSLFV